ncbi:sulfotransferase family 2 domain-containing protein [Dinoroseobacter sp. S124A]|uniref:sulfotransferase family 2 domain-containing protein n=1 Tax=Dinoroseobacter sp. S124A TaxID=3415128 RepID=UPI003C7BEB3C
MLVFHNHGLVVFSIPKTGSTALEAALLPHASLAVQAPPEHRHMNRQVFAAQWEEMLTRRYDRRFDGVALVREPVARLRSWYRYRGTAAFAGTPLSTQGISFDDFIAASLTETPPPYARIGAQDRFVAKPGGGIGITHLFDYAQMDLARDWLSAALGRDLELPRRNVSPKRAAPLSAELRARLETARAAEFALHAQVSGAGHLVTPQG